MGEPRSCHHGDIRPENILYFGPEETRNKMDMRLTSGILKLSDFGLSETHRNPSRSRNMSNTNPGPYRAPEYDGNDLKVSIESDIWSLDCVFCELVTWAIRGHVGVSTFAKKRKKENARKSASKAWNEDNRFKKSPITNARRSKNPLSLSMSLVWAEDINPMPQPEEESKVKNSVLKWLRKLITEGRIGDGESLIVDFLDYIRDRMLDPDREARHTSHDVNKFLSRCLEKGNGDTNDPYWAWQPVMEYYDHSTETSKKAITPWSREQLSKCTTQYQLWLNTPF